MLKTLKHNLFYLAFLFMVAVPNLVYSQGIQHRIENDTSRFKSGDYDRIFSYFMEDKEKINTLLKINAVDWGQLHPSVIMEFGLTPATSIEPSIALKAANWSFENGLEYALLAGFDYKVYYNFPRRQRLGKPTNGFSGNYVALGAHTLMSDHKEYVSNKLSYQRVKGASSLNVPFYTGVNLALKYGLQRRIGDIGYFDVQVGAAYTNYRGFEPSVYPVFQIGIGFGATMKKVRDFIK